MKFILLLAFGIFIFASCSIGKVANARAYKTSNKVENIDAERNEIKNKDNKDKKGEKYERYNLVSSIKSKKQREISSSTIPSTEKKHSSPPSFTEDKAIIEENFNQELSSNYPIIEKIEKSFYGTKEEDDVRKIDPISISSFIMGLLGILSIVLAFVFLDVGFLFPVLLFLGIGLLISAFVLGLIGILRKSKNRKKYKGVVFAILGFVGGVIGLLVSLFVIAFLILSFV